MLAPRTLEWDQLKHHATKFCYWTGEAANQELNWFHAAWGCVVKAGLAHYTTELERCQAAIRFLTLGYIYADFMHLLLEDNGEPWFRDTAQALDIRPFHLALLLDPEQKEALADESECYDQALIELTNTNRSAIHKLLDNAFPELLYFAMRRIGLQEEPLRNEEEVDLQGFDDAHAEACYFVLDKFHCERWY
ncbi:MAG: hypothetical protein ABI988_13105 [Nitrospirota bacterium]